MPLDHGWAWRVTSAHRRVFLAGAASPHWGVLEPLANCGDARRGPRVSIVRTSTDVAATMNSAPAGLAAARVGLGPGCGVAVEPPDPRADPDRWRRLISLREEGPLDRQLHIGQGSSDPTRPPPLPQAAVARQPLVRLPPRAGPPPQSPRGGGPIAVHAEPSSSRRRVL